MEQLVTLQYRVHAVDGMLYVGYDQLELEEMEEDGQRRGFLD